MWCGAVALSRRRAYERRARRRARHTRTMSEGFTEEFERESARRYTLTLRPIVLPEQQAAGAVLRAAGELCRQRQTVLQPSEVALLFRLYRSGRNSSDAKSLMKQLGVADPVAFVEAVWGEES